MQHWPPLAPLFDSEMFKRFCAPPDQLKGPSVMSADTIIRLDALSAAIRHCSAGGHLARGESPDVIATAKRFLHFLEGNADPRVSGEATMSDAERWASSLNKTVGGVPEAPYSDMRILHPDEYAETIREAMAESKEAAIPTAQECADFVGNARANLAKMRTPGLSFIEALVAACQGKIVKRRGAPPGDDYPFTVKFVNPYHGRGGQEEIIVTPADRRSSDWYVVE